MQVKFLTSILGLCLTAPSFAQEKIGELEQYFPQQISAKKLLNYCASSNMTRSGRERRQYCSGFVSGVEETIRLLANKQAGYEQMICVPKNVNARKLAEGYVGYARLRQDSMDLPAALIVTDALKSRYPCTKAN